MISYLDCRVLGHITLDTPSHFSQEIRDASEWNNLCKALQFHPKNLPTIDFTKRKVVVVQRTNIASSQDVLGLSRVCLPEIGDACRIELLCLTPTISSLFVSAKKLMVLFLSLPRDVPFVVFFPNVNYVVETTDNNVREVFNKQDKLKLEPEKIKLLPTVKDLINEAIMRAAGPDLQTEYKPINLLV